MSNTIIVTRHRGLVDWLIQQGVVTTATPVISRANIKDVIGKRVFGVLPIRIASYANEVISVEMPGLAVGKINADIDLSAEEMNQAKAFLVKYVVTATRYEKESNESQTIPS